MGRFGISKESLQYLYNRDKKCSYCNKVMIFPYDTKNRCDSATIEHLNFDGPFHIKTGLNIEDIVIVCGSCNSSRGIKKITDWFKTNYCISKSISIYTVSDNVRNFLDLNKLK